MVVNKMCNACRLLALQILEARPCVETGPVWQQQLLLAVLQDMLVAAAAAAAAHMLVMH
jgi:hypothetical protein